MRQPKKRKAKNMIALGNDHAGFELKQFIIELLDEKKLKYKDFGAPEGTRAEYPVFGHKAALAVSSGECDKGILICGTGVGMSLVANKVPGIRCCVCSEPYSAQLSKQHNNTNMLALGARVVGRDLALMIVNAWLDSEFEGERHAERVKMITDIEKHGEIL